MFQVNDRIKMIGTDRTGVIIGSDPQSDLSDREIGMDVQDGRQGSRYK